MKYIKRFLIFLLVLIILLAGAVYVLITFYKKDLTALLIDELKIKHGLILKVDDIKVSFLDNWPHASIELKDVVLESELNLGKSEPLLKAGSIALSFNLERMMNKEFIVKYVSIKDAEISLIKNPDGTKNFIFQKPDTTHHIQPQRQAVPESTAAISFEVNKVTIKNTQFYYINRQREQNIDIKLKDCDIKMKHYTDGIQGRFKGEVQVGGLLFNGRKGAFVTEKEAELDLHVNFFNENKTLCVYPPSYIEIDDARYSVTTLIKLTKEHKRLALAIENPAADFAKATELLTPKLQRVLRNFEVLNTVSVRVLIVANIGEKQDPALLVHFSGKNNSLKIGNSKIPYSDLSFTGSIISLDTAKQTGDIENARVVFSPVKGKIYQFPFTATINVNNLVDPKITAEADLLVEGTKIDFKVAKDFILRGSTSAHVKYSGPTEKLNTREFLENPMKLNADLVFHDMSYKAINSPYTYVLNGKANLNNRDLKFDDLNLRTVVGDAVLKGKAENFVNYILGYTNGFKANVAARTDLLDLNPLFKDTVAIDLTLTKKERTELKRLTKRERRKKLEKKKKAVASAPLKFTESKFEFNVQLFAKKMLIRKVEAQFANADLYYKNEILKIKMLNLNICEGRFQTKGTIEQLKKVQLDISAYNVNINKMFTQFENFNQEAIVNDNIKGILSFDAKVQTDLDSRKEIIGETMNGEVKLKLTNGHLINYEPVQNLSNILFKNRDFNDVYFSEINETFRLQGSKMEIEELEIASNVLDLYVVNGVYDFKGTSNINILIPWSNLKRRGKNYVPKSSGTSAQDAKGVKLNFQGRSKQMKLTFGHKELYN